jgi:hypothetical protein
MRKQHNRRVLMLNADFSPLATIEWKRAVVQAIINMEDPREGLEVIDYYEDSVLSCGGRHFPIPAVVRSPNYIRQDKKKLSFSRKHVFLRDQMTCCYCGLQSIDGEHLTYDHVVPRETWKKNKYKGTPTNWTNIVTCCMTCNRRKANRTPKEANMTLLREPKEPGPQQFILGLSPWSKIHPKWELYLTPLYKNLLNKRKAMK